MVLSNDFVKDHLISRNCRAVFFASFQPKVAFSHAYFQDNSGGRSSPSSSLAFREAAMTMSSLSGKK
jgi:hypothetical protein